MSESGRSVPGSGPRRGAARRGAENAAAGGRRSTARRGCARAGGGIGGGITAGGGGGGRGVGLDGIGGEGDDEVAVSLYEFPFFLYSFFLEFRLDRDGGRDSVDLVFGPATAKAKEGPNPNPKAGVLFAFPASHTSPDHHHQAFKLKALPAFAFPCIFPS